MSRPVKGSLLLKIIFTGAISALIASLYVTYMTLLSCIFLSVILLVSTVPTYMVVAGAVRPSEMLAEKYGPLDAFKDKSSAGSTRMSSLLLLFNIKVTKSLSLIVLLYKVLYPSVPIALYVLYSLGAVGRIISLGP